MTKGYYSLKILHTLAFSVFKIIAAAPGVLVWTVERLKYPPEVEGCISSVREAQKVPTQCLALALPGLGLSPAVSK